ncbi:MAG: pyridoxal 5'-phosphate synthase glutaminase subunit PdxT [Lachnospiraceae bacterium]|nr:pyridoxal 5'-phosphate synthase glutaminase subunit PdxT [Lachnospiraceae bacterium]MDD6618166.1 pyridoxal 5'-phosphate synthase glutaminase subunit PdxT [Clostridiales bacterium]MDY4769510.1 pyridoxal 5'-phosphate synthase glutaminase subunit PdxT [Lachnospiraceae bacterium]
MRIGVLAVQGAFIEHRHILESLGTETFEIRQLADLNEPMDGIIIPGGESTVIGKLLTDLGMMEPLKEKIRAGLPVFGTCAGMILLADKIENPTQKQVNLGTMDITVVRNAYGRQLGSFHACADFGPSKEVPMTFIRAPYISEVGPNAEILSEVDGHIVAARQDNQLVTAFHPELTQDTRVHEYFLNSIAAS